MGKEKVASGHVLPLLDPRDGRKGCTCHALSGLAIFHWENRSTQMRIRVSPVHLISGSALFTADGVVVVALVDMPVYLVLFE